MVGFFKENGSVPPQLVLELKQEVRDIRRRLISVSPTKAWMKVARQSSWANGGTGSRPRCSYEIIRNGHCHGPDRCPDGKA